MQSQYNMRSPAVKRLMKEAQELRDPTEQYHVQPLDDNLFEWHFTIRGPADSDFDGGIYHGRIILPPDYPMKPPSIILLTPNGRFEVFKKICLSISGHHPESWQPSWSIRTALLAIIGFMPTHGAGAIGSLDYTPEERKVLAKKSQEWKCVNCGCIGQILPDVTQASEQTRQEAKELASQINFQGEKAKEAKTSESTSSKEAPEPSSPNQETITTTSSPSSPSSPASTPATPSAQPTQFPWNPFMTGAPPPQFCMPPFPQMPHMQPGSPNTMVPRFPLPCYAPMFPPQMFPPGFRLPNTQAWLPQQPSQTATTETSQSTVSNTAGAPSTNQSTVNNTAGAPLSNQSQVSNSQPASQAITSSSEVTSTASASSSSVSSATTSSNPSTAESDSSTVPSTSTTTTTEPSSLNIGVRQRTVPAPSTRVFQSAEIPNPPPSSRGTWSLVLIVLLVCSIGLLVFRRLYFSFEWNLLFR